MLLAEGRKKKSTLNKKSCRTTTDSVRHGPSHSQISVSAISCSCSNRYTSKCSNISPDWRVCLADCPGCSHIQPSLYFLSHSCRQQWWPFTELPDQKTNTTLFLVGRRKTEHNSGGRDRALCCWDNGKCGRRGKQGETRGRAFQTRVRNVSLNPQTGWCRPHQGRYWWEFCGCVSLFHHQLKLCFYCFHSDE